jgi:hypothetical protein
VTGPDRRDRLRDFLEPLELEDLEARPPKPEAEDDPSVFDRITAVPSEVPAALIAQTRKQEDDPVSGLYDRTEPALGVPAPSAGEVEEPQPVAPTQAPDSSTRTTTTGRPAPLPPVGREATSEVPAVLGSPGGTKRERRRVTRPFGSPSRPNVERASRRPSTPHQPAAVELELELVDVNQEPSDVALANDALEVEIPTRGALGVPSGPPPDAPEIREMKDRYATGDFSGALVVAEGILESDPHHEEAARYQQRCSETLSQMYLARLGSLTQVVRVAVARDQIRWLSLDHRAGFLLSLVDGTSSIEELLDVSTMPRLEALRILHGLLDQRVIALS